VKTGDTDDNDAEQV